MQDYETNASPPVNANRIIIKLEEDKSRLAHRLGRLESLCENQAYRIGYMNAELKEKTILL